MPLKSALCGWRGEECIAALLVPFQVSHPLGGGGAGTAGDGAYCIGCMANTFAPVHGLATCFACPANAASGNASANCTCAAGYEGLVTSADAGVEDGRCAVNPNP